MLHAINQSTAVLFSITEYADRQNEGVNLQAAEHCAAARTRANSNYAVEREAVPVGIALGDIHATDTLSQYTSLS